MAQTLNIELLQLLEDKLGKEEGRKVAEAIEIGLGLIEKKAEAVALQKVNKSNKLRRRRLCLGR
jgi:hypothetical protein